MCFRGPSVQSVPGTRRCVDGEEETTKDQDHVHLCPAEGVGEGLPGDALPRHLHQGGDRYEDRPDRG